MTRCAAVLLTGHLLLLPAGVALGGNVTLTDPALPPDLTASEVQLTIVISNIDATQRAKLEADTDLLVDNLEIILTAVDTSTPLKFKAEDATETVPFYVEKWADPSLESSTTDTTSTLTLYVVIKESIGGKFAEYFAKTADTTMEIEISYKEGETTIVDQKTFTLKREIFAIDAAPAFAAPAVEGTHRQLRARWVHRKDAPIKGLEGTKEPKRVNVYVIERDQAADIQLKAKKFSSTTGATTDVVTCRFVPPATDSGACVSCEADVYLDQAQIAKQGIAGLKVVQAQSSEEIATVTGLENEKQYFVFLQWEPSGLRVSDCVVGQPSPNLSLTELNGEGEAKVVDFRCFIATAAYGTPLHEDLALFRGFRDEVLLRSWAGRRLVAAYYRLSPPLAGFIERHPSLKAGVRAGLEHVAAVLRRGR